MHEMLIYSLISNCYCLVNYWILSTLTDMCLLNFLYLRVCIALCEAEATTNIGDCYGNTPLHYACSNGHIQIVKYLIQNGGCLERRLVKNKKNKSYEAFIFSHMCS